MNQREIDIMKIEESFKNRLENDLIKNENTEDRRVKVIDIKYVGEARWQDKINQNDLSDNLFIASVEIQEIDEEKEERTTIQDRYYLGDKCIGGRLGENEITFKESFEVSEPDKYEAVKELLERVSDIEIENNSLNNLRTKELEEILSAHLGRKVEENEIENLIEEMDVKEIEDIKEESEEKDIDENRLSEKQAEKITVNGIQKVDLNNKVDGYNTLANRLDLNEYEILYVVYSDKIDDISYGEKRNNTTYSLVGMDKNGEARVLNDEFEMDKSVGNSGTKEQTKVRADGTATIDNNDMSIYTRKSNGMSIGCENQLGNVNMFLYDRTRENENVGIQIETSQTPIIHMETKEILQERKGSYQKDSIQNEIEKHIDEGCKIEDEKDFDGNPDTKTHFHIEDHILDKVVEEIMNYENDEGENKIKEVFTEKEVREKVLKEMEECEGNLSIEEITEKTEKEMNEDAEMLSREHDF